MKKQFKLTTFLIMVCLLFVNCDKDDSQNEPETEQKVQSIIQRVSFSEIQQNRVLSEKLNLIKNKKQTTVDGKLVYSNAFNFYIETDEAIYIETDDGLKHSYTFAIMRDENTTELENLVLYLQEDGTYAMKIVTYQYTEQDRLDQTNGLPVDLTDKVSYQSINDEGVITSIFSLEVTCLTILISSCEYGNSEHWGGYDGVNKCPGYQENEFAQLGDCGSGGGGGGGFDSGADPSTSDSSGTTNIQTWNTQGGGSGIGTSPIEPPVEPSTEEKIEMCFGQLSNTTTVVELTPVQY